MDGGLSNRSWQCRSPRGARATPLGARRLGSIPVVKGTRAVVEAYFAARRHRLSGHEPHALLHDELALDGSEPRRLLGGRPRAQLGVGARAVVVGVHDDVALVVGAQRRVLAVAVDDDVRLRHLKQKLPLQLALLWHSWAAVLANNLAALQVRASEEAEPTVGGRGARPVGKRPISGGREECGGRASVLHLDRRVRDELGFGSLKLGSQLEVAAGRNAGLVAPWLRAPPPLPSLDVHGWRTAPADRAVRHRGRRRLEAACVAGTEPAPPQPDARCPTVAEWGRSRRWLKRRDQLRWE